MSNNRNYEIVKEIMKIIIINKSEIVKWKYELSIKLIFFYYLKLFLTLNHIIKSVYKTYLIYLITYIKLLNNLVCQIPAKCKDKN